MKVYFEQVTLKAKKTFLDNGKRRQQTHVFMQTINPYNKNADGSQKSRIQIMDELRKERDKWLTG